MIKNKVINESTHVSEIIIHGIQEKKGSEIVRLDLRNIHSSVTDYFVVCHAESAMQVRAITKGIEDEVFKATGQWPFRTEGQDYGEWVLIDYIDVVVHVFKTDKRQYYGIEELWGDAEMQYYQSA